MSSVASYGRHGGFELRRISSVDVRVVFQSFASEELLVLVTSDLAAPENYLRNLLKHVHNGVVLLLGRQAFTRAISSGNPDLQRHLRVVNKLADYICQEDSPPFGVSLRAVEMHPLRGSAERAMVVTAMEALAEAASIECACITINHRVCFATSPWWSLNPSELLLLQGLLCAMLPATLRDVPVYLPVTNPLKPVRLVTVALCAGAELALLCADTPTLGDAGKLARHYLMGVAKILKDAQEQSQQQGWPSSITGNPNIQACAFVSRTDGLVSLAPVARSGEC
ncbi:hypothetical protein CYMTET_24252 [Cymbomonas tetramitiformis]|uniref:Uncharacterized protein n=1 Tax=Cymbomonas tetramitiformis TaxID=36881 RepID=A0AAE0FWR0_9CHLO|nr:hypothetical protein CYMTET_24252 [Cymbomonas tetramitiformis]